MTNKKNIIPNRKIRSIILVLIAVVFIVSIIHVAIAKEHHILNCNNRNTYETDKNIEQTTSEEKEQNYNDSEVINTLYKNIYEFPNIEDMNTIFKVSDLTDDEKNKLVIASLKSKSTGQTPINDISNIQSEIIYNNTSYKLTSVPQAYEYVDVLNTYYDLYGTVATFEPTNNIVLNDTLYNYQPSTGYILYKETTPKEKTKSTVSLQKATKKSSTIRLYLLVDNKTEVYTFEEVNNYKYIFTGKEK